MPLDPVKPELVSGTQDFLPTDALAQQILLNKLQRIYESFGFVPLDTPCLEKWGVLTQNDPDFNKSIFRATVVRGAEDRDIAAEELGSADSTLRFDLTVPLARVVAAYPNLPRPFKRYQIGRVFRGETPGAGKFREFTQFDFDIVGSTSILADAEIIQAIYATMAGLGMPRYVIRFNTRKILNGLAEIVGCKDKAKEFFRVIDKADKIGMAGIITDLKRQPDNQYDENALAMNDAQVAIVEQFLQLRGQETAQILEKLKGIVASWANESASLGLQELESLTELLGHIKMPQECWAVDLSVARGLDYYNGPVFETNLLDLPKLGSVLSGGRFDGLVNRFMPGSNIPGVGASVGLERMLIGLQHYKLIPESKTTTQVLVTVFNAELQNESFVLANELREAGINTEVYLGNDSMLRAQFTYAAKQDIPFTVVIGPQEAAQGMVQLKDMRSRLQKNISRADCVKEILSAL